MPTLYRVTVDSSVYTKLVRQWDYLVYRAGLKIADAYIDGLMAYFRGLDTFPERGHPRDDLLLDLRVIGYGKSANLAIVVEPSDVYVVGVYFGGEDYESALREPTLPS